MQEEYQNLVNGLIDQGLLDQPANDIGLASVRISWLRQTRKRTHLFHNFSRSDLISLFFVIECFES